MAIMTTQEKDHETLGIDRREVEGNPTIITLYDSQGNEVGFVTVYIDNIIVAVVEGCEDKMLLRKWEARLRANARSLRKAEFKYMNLTEEVVEYLGVQYEWNEEIRLSNGGGRRRSEECGSRRTQDRCMIWCGRLGRSRVGPERWCGSVGSQARCCIISKSSSKQ